MKKIKINFVDFGDCLKDNIYIIEILKNFSDVTISDDPEYLFCGEFGNEHLNYKNCIKIFIQSEELSPDFNLYDYAISYEKIDYYDRCLYLPMYARKHYRSLVERINNPILNTKNKFCNFIYSNPNADIFRKDTFIAINNYKHVDSAGRYLNNMNDKNCISDRFDNDWVESKIKFMSNYKFSIAFGNAKKYGYTDEKVFHAWAAGTVPIVWGDPTLSNIFNKNSYIDCNDCTTPEEVVEKVKEIDLDEEKYSKMLFENKIANSSYLDKLCSDNYIENFLKNIILIDNNLAKRISNGSRSINYQKLNIFYNKISKSLIGKIGNKLL